MRCMAVVVVALGCGCGGGASPAPPPANVAPIVAANDPVVDHLRAFRDDMCACKDRRCAHEIQREIGRWHDRAGAGVTAQTTEARQLEDQVTACERTARGSAASTGQMMAKFGEFADQMCSCTDAACAQKVSDAMSKWAATQAAASPPEKLDEDEIKESTKIGERLGDCMTKALSVQQPQTPP